MEVLNMCDEIGVLNRVCKPYPRSMKINVVGEGRLSTLKVVGFLAKLRLKLRQNIDLSDDPSIKELLSTLTTTKNIDTVIDPMMSGVWAGDIGKLSAKSTLAGILPELKDSWISKFEKALPASKWVMRYKRYLWRSGSFAFKSGFSDLINALEKSLKYNGVDIIRNSTISKVVHSNGKVFNVHYQTKNKTIRKEFDYVVSALPAHSLGSILKSSTLKGEAA